MWTIPLRRGATVRDYKYYGALWAWDLCSVSQTFYWSHVICDSVCLQWLRKALNTQQTAPSAGCKAPRCTHTHTRPHHFLSLSFSPFFSQSSPMAGTVHHRGFPSCSQLNVFQGFDEGFVWSDRILHAKLEVSYVSSLSLSSAQLSHPHWYLLGFPVRRSLQVRLERAAKLLPSAYFNTVSLHACILQITTRVHTNMCHI